MRGYLALLLVLALPALATVFQTGDTVTVQGSQPVNDDLMVTGGTVTVSQPVTDDLVVWGGTVTAQGPVGNNLIVGGGTVTLGGSVANDLIVTGGTVTVDGKVGGTIYAAGGTVTLNGAASRNVTVAGGTVTVGPGASVGRDLSVTGGTVTIQGTVTRNAILDVGTLTVASTAKIGGDLTGRATSATIDSGATIGQNTLAIGERPGAGKADQRGPRAFFPGFSLMAALWLLPVGVLFLWLAPKLAGESLEILRAHPWASVLTGLLFGLLAPPALLIAAIVTCGLGLSVALIGVQLLGILAYVGLAIPLLWVGMLILRKGTPSRYSAFLLGLLLLFAAGIIPVLGFLVWMAVAVLGFGAIMLALLARWGHPMVGHRPAPPAEAAPEAM